VTSPEQVWDPADGAFIRHCPTYAITARPEERRSSWSDA